jgi:hypothetical protein
MDDEAVFRPHTDPHRRAWDAIPWVAAGAADDDDTQHVLRHVALCAECHAEWALHQRVGRALQSGAPPSASHTDAAWERLAARLDDEASSAPDANAHGVTSDSASVRASVRAAGGGPWTRWLVAAVVVQAIGLGAAGLALREKSLAAEVTGEFRTLSEAVGAPLLASVRLVPSPQMTFGTLQPLLARTNMVVVEVAADGGSLGLAAADGQARTVHAALRQLRATPGVVLAEPVAPGPR